MSPETVVAGHRDLLGMDAKKSGSLKSSKCSELLNHLSGSESWDFVLRCSGFCTWSASTAIMVLMDGHSNLMVGLGRKPSQESS